MKNNVFAAIMLLAASACSDNGRTAADGGTGNGSLVSFSSSECKKESAEALVASLSRSLVTGVSSADYDGLKCVSWDVGADGSGRFDLINFESACGPRWAGSADTGEGNAVSLTVNNPGCMLAACGSCIYDWSFEVSGLSAGTDVSLSINVNACPEETGSSNNDTYSLSVPAAAAPAGVVCRYASFGALEWQAMSLGTEGEYMMPCTDPNNHPEGEAPPPCKEGLTCTAMAPGTYRDSSICLRNCAAAACAHPDLMSCQEGLCKLTAEW
jgi:hypothetical protein